ncbi:transmembrane protein 60-like [Oppia nitens]|uniref:transmembrane protein 60-like n=1 Tax=Oppia nitens TaxID=1686743 RepID=UPI0023DBB2A4|nr:transmembrane protein 60-like [Oppia nitens]
MSVIHRSLFSLVSLALFVVLVAIKVDNKCDWNWFVVFIPMFVLDLLMCLMLAMKWLRTSPAAAAGLSTASTSATNRWSHSISMATSSAAQRRLYQNIYCLTCLLTKLTFQVVICLRLDYISGSRLPLYITFIPFWLCIISCLGLMVSTRFISSGNRSIIS